jgi:hypothetical protein
MPQQIVKQLNGLYAIWSTVVDDFVMIDATPEDIIADRIERESGEIRRRVNNVIAELESGMGRPYHQFTMTFAECVAAIKERHGADAESLKLCRESGLTT